MAIKAEQTYRFKKAATWFAPKNPPTTAVRATGLSHASILARK